MNGVIVVDKPGGLTSHDVVREARRALGTRAIGHTGTLDPLATGVLVLLVGQATKLAQFLQAVDKTYEVTIAPGAATTTLDIDGQVERTMPVPLLTTSEVVNVAHTFMGRHEQRVPDFSAVKVDGVALHKKARRGESVQAPTRPVTLHEVTVLSVQGGASRASCSVFEGLLRALVRA